MLVLNLEPETFFDEETMEFVDFGGQSIKLEHSLFAISKWESKFEKPYLDNPGMTADEMMYYIYCMTVGEVSNPELYTQLNKQHLERIQKYIDSKQTATTVNSIGNSSGGKQIVTSELIYYWMIAHQIPWECQHWHLNRLIMLIRVCAAKNNPKKESTKSAIERHREQNRRAREAEQRQQQGGQQ